MTAYGVMFHHFYDDVHPRGQGAISREDLAALIAHVGRDNILSARVWMERALQGTLGENDVCLTFDDALLCQYDVALPLLDDMGLTAFWFVYSSVFDGNPEPLEIYRYFRTTSFTTVDEFYDAFFAAVEALYPEEWHSHLADFDPADYLVAFPFYSRNDRIFRFVRDDVLRPKRYRSVMDDMIAARGLDVARLSEKLWMTNAHLRRLQQGGHLVGLHSYSHPTRLAELPIEMQCSEYQRNFEHLAGILGGPPTCMSHPCNSYAPGTAGILSDLGVRLGFRANMERVAAPTMFEFPREDHANLMQRLRS
jgi:peptidoglycan/xylan/chitin deacetylase (PgdA/CDA1 family)